jgi:hypothetical protein
MTPPEDNWSWSSGTIDHFDIQGDLKSVVKDIALAIATKKFVPDYIYSSSSDHTPGWEDYTLQFLTAKQERNWEFPGKEKVS